MILNTLRGSRHDSDAWGRRRALSGLRRQVIARAAGRSLTRHPAVPRLTVLALTVLIGPAAATWATTSETATDRAAPPVEALVEDVLEHAPALEAARQRVAAARASVKPAAALPDPMVEIMYQDASFPDWSVGAEPMSMIGPEVRQGFLFPGKRDARGAVAESRVSVRASEVEALARALVLQVRSLYARLYALDEELHALGAGRELLEVLSATASTRYATGAVGQEAVIKAQLAAARIEERTEDLRAERAAAVAELAALLNRPDQVGFGRVSVLPEPLPPSPSWVRRAAAGSADVLRRRAEVDESERQLHVAHLELKPNLFAAAGLGLRGALDPVATLRIGLEVPLWSKQKQKQQILAAEAEVAAAGAELTAAINEATALAQRLEAAWLRDDRQIELYRESIVPRTSAAVDAARTAYLTGTGDFSTVIENFYLWLEARAQLARRSSARFATWAQAEALLGPESASGSGGVE